MSLPREFAWVLVSRSAGLVVNLVFLPLYARLLGPQAFGHAALVMTLLALLALLDLGTGPQLNRDFASASLAGTARLWRVRVSARLLASASLLALPALLCIPSASLHLLLAVAALAAFQWQWQLQLAALQASQRFSDGAWLSLLGHLSRALATGGALWVVEADLGTFLGAQVSLTAMAWWFSRRQVDRQLNPARTPVPPVRWPEVVDQLHGSRALVWSGLVGAVATQIDKVLVSASMSPAALTPYFLATTLAAAPLSMLGAPLAQYLQSKLAALHSQGEHAAERRLLRFGLWSAALGVALPSLLLAVAAPQVAGAWLHGHGDAALVAGYARILLPAYAVAAIGYIPFAIVMARGDFGFQSRWATSAMVLQMLALAAAAQAHSVVGMCWAWMGYFCWATAGLTWRAWWLMRPRNT